MKQKFFPVYLSYDLCEVTTHLLITLTFLLLNNTETWSYLAHDDILSLKERLTQRFCKSKSTQHKSVCYVKFKKERKHSYKSRLGGAVKGIKSVARRTL